MYGIFISSGDSVRSALEKSNTPLDYLTMYTSEQRLQGGHMYVEKEEQRS
jgi:hypothetical protein